MGKHILFLVHGMGVYVDGDGKPANAWHNKAQQAIVDAANRSETLDLLSLKKDQILKKVQFEPINYDHIFNRLAGGWQKKGGELAKFPGFEGLGNIFANAAKLKDNFLWTHAADVLMYKIPYVRNAVKHYVLSQIMRVLNENDRPRWSIVGHSLGTAVTHDVIDLYEKIYRGEEVWAERPDLVAMIANVSRILQSGGTSVYSSNTVPGPTGASRFFLSADHNLDPFTQIRKFRPPPTGPFSGEAFISAHGLDHIALPDNFDFGTAVQDVSEFIVNNNPHGFAYYMANPRVHLPLISKITGREVSESEIEVAEDDYMAGVSGKAEKSIRDFLEAKAKKVAGLDSIEDLNREQLAQKFKTLLELWGK